MGLDGVELIMIIEEKFGTEITDAEASNILTPRELTNLVLTKVPTTSQSACFSQKVFHLLRRVAVGEFGASRRTFLPDTPLENVVPREDRRSNWRLFADRVRATKWPTLGRPTWIVSSLGVAAFLVFFGAWETFWFITKSNSDGFVVAATIGAALIWTEVQFSRPFQVEMPNAQEQVGHSLGT
jgi:hypothetical protein